MKEAKILTSDEMISAVREIIPPEGCDLSDHSATVKSFARVVLALAATDDADARYNLALSAVVAAYQTSTTLVLELDLPVDTRRKLETLSVP